MSNAKEIQAKAFPQRTSEYHISKVRQPINFNSESSSKMIQPDHRVILDITKHCLCRGKSINKVEITDFTLDIVLDKLKKLFRELLSLISDFKAAIRIAENARQFIFKDHESPHSLMEHLEHRWAAYQLKSEPIDWASPLSCVAKPNWKIRICVDFKEFELSKHRTTQEEINPPKQVHEDLTDATTSPFTHQESFTKSHEEVIYPIKPKIRMRLERNRRPGKGRKGKQNGLAGIDWRIMRMVACLKKRLSRFGIHIIHTNFHFRRTQKSSIQSERQAFGPKTLIRQMKYLRKMLSATIDLVDWRIGGIDITFELDETTMGMSKYHRGHPVICARFLRGIEKTSERKAFPVEVSNRQA
ncbi:hypothetical protein RF11_09745 [Thelohanellus kitauei]|uniref:Uncharacterized protein n=1 Tax=Thelohanellus kitauei TaxID=669202 RepID=A0A0C2MIM7_THEKT|nr:hypothetical protein RF11_09745 [Thelohanellus kitauei]